MANPITLNPPTVRHRVEAPVAAIHTTIWWAAAWIIWSIDMGAWVKDRFDRFEAAALEKKWVQAVVPGSVAFGVVIVFVIGTAANW